MISEEQDHRQLEHNLVQTPFGFAKPLLLGLSYLSQAPRKGKSLKPRYLCAVSGDFPLMFEGLRDRELDLDSSPCYQSKAHKVTSIKEVLYTQ